MADGDDDLEAAVGPLRRTLTPTLTNLSETVGQPLVAAVLGYSASLIEGGVSDEAADLMAVEYHGTLLRQLFPDRRSVPEPS